jgi:Beta-1,4-N-acetylgalactosaminyltransferase (CgtA)
MNTICGWLRIRNEIKTLEKCLKSIENIFDYVVITHNNCTDGSDIFLEDYIKNKNNYFLYKYEYDVIPICDKRYKEKFKYENSLAALYNFALSKVKCDNDYLFKIDGDTIYDSNKLKELVTFIRHRVNQESDVFICHGYDCTILNNEFLVNSCDKGKNFDQYCCKKSFVETFEQTSQWEAIKYKDIANFIKLNSDLIFINVCDGVMWWSQKPTKEVTDSLRKIFNA